MISIATAERESALALRRRWSGHVEDTPTPVQSPRPRRASVFAARFSKSPKVPQAPDMLDNPLLHGEVAERFQLRQAAKREHQRSLQHSKTAPHDEALVSVENPMRRGGAAPAAASLSAVRNRRRGIAEPHNATGASPTSTLRSRVWKAFGPGGALSLSATPVSGRGPGLVLRSAGRRSARLATEATRARPRQSRSSSSALPEVTNELGSVSRPGATTACIDAARGPHRASATVLDPSTASYNAWSHNPLILSRSQLDPATASWGVWTHNPVRRHILAHVDPTTAPLNAWTPNPLLQRAGERLPVAAALNRHPEVAASRPVRSERPAQLIIAAPPVERATRPALPIRSAIAATIPLTLRAAPSLVFREWKSNPLRSMPTVPLDGQCEAIPRPQDETCSASTDVSTAASQQPSQNDNAPLPASTISQSMKAPAPPSIDHDARATPPIFRAWKSNPLRSTGKPNNPPLSGRRDFTAGAGVRRSDPLPVSLFHAWKLNPMTALGHSLLLLANNIAQRK